jgi:hypothetical protein
VHCGGRGEWTRSCIVRRCGRRSSSTGPSGGIGNFHLRMRLQRRRFASDAQPTCRSAGFDFQGRLRSTLSCTSPISSYPLQRAETRSRLLRGLGTGAGRLEKDGDVGGFDRVFRSAIGGEDNGGFRGSRGDVNGVPSCCTYRWALDSISKLYAGCVERLRRVG